MVEEKASLRTQVWQAVRDGGRDGRTWERDPLLGLSVVMILAPGADPVINQLICVKRVGTSVERMETSLR